MKFFTIPFLLFPLFTIAQQTDWKLMNLKGRPKVVMSNQLYIHYSHFSKSGFLTLTTTNIQGKSYRTEFEYSSDGRKSQEINCVDGEISERIEYRYDSTGQQQKLHSGKVEYITSVAAGNATFDRKITKSDKFNNPVEVTHFLNVEGHQPEISEIEIFHYRHDKYGNWIERKRYLKFREDQDFREGGVDTREITYYK